MIDNWTFFAAAAGFISGGMALGLLIGAATTNLQIVEECQRQHNVYECTVIAIPKEKKETYEGISK